MLALNALPGTQETSIYVSYYFFQHHKSHINIGDHKRIVRKKFNFTAKVKDLNMKTTKMLFVVIWTLGSRQLHICRLIIN